MLLKIFNKHKNLIIIVACFSILAIIFVSGTINFTRKVNKLHPVGSDIEVISGSGHKARLLITSQHSEWFFGVKTITIYGELWVIKPESTNFLGIAEGSVILSFSYQDGTGQSWFFDNIEPTERLPSSYYIRVVEVRVCNSYDECSK